jgi:HEAT repeat protein
LTDTDAEVRSIAFRQLGNYDLTGIPQQQSIAQQALARLRDPNTTEDERWSAAIALGNSGDAAKATATDLGRILQHPHTAFERKGDVADVLGHLGAAATPYIPDLVKLAKVRGGGDPPRYQAVAALAQLDTPITRSAKYLLEIARDRDIDASFRNETVEQLGKSPNAANYAQDFSDILKDRGNYPFPACGAVISLGNLGDAATPYVFQMWSFFTDRSLDNSTQHCATTALSNLNRAAAPHAPYFLKILKNTSSPVAERRQAATILGNIGTVNEADRRDLIALLKNPQTDTVVKIAIATALGNFGDATQPNFTDFWTIVKSPDADRDLRNAAATAFGKSDRAVTALIGILGDPNLDRIGREAAARGLDNIGVAVRAHAKQLVTLATKLGKISANQAPDDPRTTGGYGLKHLGTAAQPHLPELLAIVKDKRSEPQIRSDAARAIVNAGKSPKPFTQALLALAVETIARSPGDMSPLYAIEHLALPQLAPLCATDLRPLVNILATDNRELGWQYGRFMVYFYSGGDRDV